MCAGTPCNKLQRRGTEPKKGAKKCWKAPNTKRFTDHADLGAQSQSLLITVINNEHFHCWTVFVLFVFCSGSLGLADRSGGSYFYFYFLGGCFVLIMRVLLELRLILDFIPGCWMLISCCSGNSGQVPDLCKAA